MWLTLVPFLVKHGPLNTTRIDPGLTPAVAPAYTLPSKKRKEKKKEKLRSVLEGQNLRHFGSLVVAKVL